MSLQQSSPQDQRSVLIGSTLIALILFVWMWYTTPGVEQKPSSQEPPITDTTEAVEEERMVEQQRRADQQAEEGTEPGLAAVADSSIAGAQDGTARRITVETDLYEAVFSTKGATPVSFILKEYKQFDQETPVQIIDTTNAGALAMVFTTPQNHLVDTRSFYFEPSAGPNGGAAPERIEVTGEDTAQLTFTADVGEGTITQTYTFTGDTYEVDLSVDQQNAATFATSSGYELMWDGGVPYTEGSPEDEAPQTGAFAYSGDEIVELLLQEEATSDQKTLNGQVDWVAVKNKYFTAVMIPGGETRGAELVGDKPQQDVPERPYWKDFKTRLEMPAPQQGQADTYRLYLGPMEYYHLADYDLGLYGMVDYGWNIFEWITRPIATFFFIPIFGFLSSFIPNYGVVIILLAILVKTLVYPLTKSSYRSMAKMRELQPEMEAIKEQHGDNPQKQQEAMMKLYKDAGANPIGGCLPMLLQYPIIIALYQYIPQSIQLRQESFLWAHDLSAPDVILNLPFTIPFFGDYVAGFTLLMGLSMVVTMQVQSSMSAGGAQMKMLMYFMPIMIFFIFNRFASALSLYYLFYNIVTAIQQKYINNQIEAEGKEEGGSKNGKGSKKDVKKAKRRRVNAQ